MERFPTEDGEKLRTERGDTGPEIMGWEGLKKTAQTRAFGRTSADPSHPPTQAPCYMVWECFLECLRLRE